MTFLEPFITALSDVLKHEIMSRVNTGDRTRDNCLIGLILVVVSYLVKTIMSGSLNKMYKQYKLSRIKILDKETVDFINKCDLETYTPHTFLSEVHIAVEHQEILNKICQLYNNIYNSNTLYILNANNKLVPKYGRAKDAKELREYLHKLYVDNLAIIYGDDKTKKPTIFRYVIYANNGGFVFLAANDKNIKLELTTSSLIQEFHKYVDSLILNGDNPPICTAALKIYDGTNVAELRSDRNLQMYVSKHKKKIISMLDRFLSNKPTLGGYGSLNLGIMLHGEPGTGKTLLMKAIANYLNRSIRIIDMRTITTKDDFNSLFKTTNDDTNDYKQLVYVLDEFDCVKGIVANRSNKSNDTIENNNNSEIEKLKERRLQLLQVPTVGDNNKDNINAELNKIDEEISDIENSLTLDTMLTTLDGVIEHTGRVIIAATNHIDHIDPALLREGRFDIKIKLEKFDEEETRELLGVMFHDAPAKDIAKLAKTKLASGVYTPAQLVNMASECGTLANILRALSKKNV
jgi:hypothetical protein